MQRQLSIMKWGILGLFFVSGAPALLYQIIWQHHLYTIYGAHAESVAIIVGAFMFGLGIGSLVGGEVSARWRRSPFYLFAIIESLIGVFGYFSLELFDAVGAGTTHLGVFGAGVSSFMLVVLPTVAMGATLPILANALIARLKNVGVSIGNLYFVNTLGSAVAAYASLSIFSAGLGQHGAIEVAVLLNLIVVCAAVLLRFVSGRTTPPAAEKQMTSESATNKVASSDDKRARAFAAVLSLCSGFLALSVEIVWFRVTFLFAQGKAYAFPISLAFFLLGIAAGSLYAARLMKKESAESSRVRMMAADIMLISGITISMVFLFTGVLAATGAGVLLFLLTTLLAFPLGVLFPLLMHAGVFPNGNAGRGVSYIYAANILGSTLGSLGTGFILLEYVSLRGIVFLLAGMSVLLALFLFGKARTKPRTLLGVSIALLLMLLCYYTNAGLYEKLVTVPESAQDRSFARTIENRSGVINVTEDKMVFGTGVYDGRYNTDLIHDLNGVIRPYALSAFHASTSRVLVIGLASGSWAQILAQHPEKPEVDILEINPGHLKLIPEYDEVASLLSLPRVHVIIEDGRRYLTRHPEEKYDAIVMNTSYYWRSGSSNLLSQEFLLQLRAHLSPYGIIMYNTTDSDIVNKTGLSTFPYGWRVYNSLILSDAPMPIDRTRLLKTLSAYRIDNKLVFDLSRATDTAALARIAGEFDPAQEFSTSTLLEDREHYLARLMGVPILTDDNMLIEWLRPK